VIRPSSIVAWRGSSAYDGSPIQLVVSNLRRPSGNAKTGPDVVQSWILRSDVEPHVAVRDGRDVAVCGPCPLRHGQGCYVQIHQAPLGVYRWARRQRVDYLGAVDALVRTPRMVRWGSYGDVGSIPREYLEPLLHAADGIGGHACYTQAWRRPGNEWLQRWAMASTYGHHETALAIGMGWRPFAAHAGKTTPVDTRPCPSLRGLTCQQCRACDGHASGRRGGVAIPAHGAKASKVRRLAVLTDQLAAV